MFLRISLTILVLLALAASTRMYQLAHFGLDSCETQTLCIINGYETHGVLLPILFTREEIRKHKTYRNVVNATISNNGNNVAYHILLSWWTKVFGNTNYSLRFLSLVFGLMSVILGYYFARQLFNERTAIIAGVLICLHPMLIAYGQLAQSNMMTAFFALLSTYSLYQVAVSKRHLWLHFPLYVIAVVLCMMCNYSVLYVLVSHVFLVLFFHSHKRAMIKYALMATAIMGMFSIWIFNGGLEGYRLMKTERNAIIQHETTSNLPGQVEPTLSQVLEHAVLLFGFDFRSLFLPFSIGLFFILLTSALLFFALKKIRKSEYFRQAMFALFPVGFYFLFAISMLFVDSHSGLIDTHIASYAMPFACIIVAFGVDRMMQENVWVKRLSLLCLACVVMFMFASAFPNIFFKTIAKEADPFPYHHAADFIESRSAEGDEFVFRNHRDALLTNLYINRKIDIKERIDSSMTNHDIVLMKNKIEIATYQISKK